MKHVGYFNTFLRDSVNLSQWRLDLLEERVEAIYAALKDDPDLGPRIIGKLPQGSWAQRTIISPQNGKPFDADFMLHMREEEEWSNDVRQYTAAVYKVIHNHSIYKDMPHSKKCRCVYVEYANNAMHVDIVPLVTLADGTQNIINRDDNEWERTAPAAFTTWMREKDKIANGNLRKVIRLLKFLRDHKNSFTGTKSILITTLLGMQVEEGKQFSRPGYCADAPTALLHIVSDLDDWLQERRDQPSIADPSGTGLTFDHRWSQETYAYFRDRIHVHAAEINDACHEEDPAASVEKWQSLFGSAFQAPRTSGGGGKFTTTTSGVANPGEWGSSSSGRSGRAG
jgi:hypothetical protein